MNYWLNKRQQDKKDLVKYWRKVEHANITDCRLSFYEASYLQLDISCSDGWVFNVRDHKIYDIVIQPIKLGVNRLNYERNKLICGIKALKFFKKYSSLKSMEKYEIAIRTREHLLRDQCTN
jgi:hypothetical protein